MHDDILYELDLLFSGDPPGMPALVCFNTHPNSNSSKKTFLADHGCYIIFRALLALYMHAHSITDGVDTDSTHPLQK